MNFTDEQIMLFQQGVNELTKTERMIFGVFLVLRGMFG